MCGVRGPNEWSCSQQDSGKHSFRLSSSGRRLRWRPFSAHGVLSRQRATARRSDPTVCTFLAVLIASCGPQSRAMRYSVRSCQAVAPPASPPPFLLRARGCPLTDVRAVIGRRHQPHGGSFGRTPGHTGTYHFIGGELTSIGATRFCRP
jgi:hypothetical protein